MFPPGNATWGVVAEDHWPHGQICAGICHELAMPKQLVLVLSTTYLGETKDMVLHYECAKDLFIGMRGPTVYLQEQAAQIRDQYLRKP